MLGTIVDSTVSPNKHGNCLWFPIIDKWHKEILSDEHDAIVFELLAFKL